MAEEKTAITVPENILAGFDNSVEWKEMIFRFKKDKLGNKRANVELKLPVPSVEGIVQILTKGAASDATPEAKKALDLLLECAAQTVRDVAGSYVSDNEEVNSTNFPYNSVTWQAIANMPKEDRRSSSIAKEVWEAFCKDYITVMPGATGKTVDNVTNATLVYLKKFSIVKSNKKIVSQLKDQLAIYANTSKEAENYQEILELLNEKADAYINSNEIENIVNNL